jgi:hypothetical protein
MNLTFAPMRGSMDRGNPTSAPGKRPFQVAVVALLFVAAAIASGCGSGASLIHVGPIAFVDANGNQLGGTHTSLSVGGTTYVDVAVAGDTSTLGVDWTVNCGSAPPPGTPLPPGDTEDQSCGFFTPVHTASAPVPEYAASGAGIVTVYTAPAAPPKEGVVTLYAAATADHSRYSTVTLTILAQPISISFAPAPPSTLPVSGTTSLKVVLTNDYVAAGANWTVTCGSSDCGSFSPAQTASGVATTYTAPASVPAGGSVQVTATSVTDPTKSVSANISILPITVTIAQSAQSVVINGTALFTAAVANDVSNAGVDWTLACGTAGACGSITAHTATGIAATYTAPSTVPGAGSVQVTATSTSNAMASAMATVTITSAAVVSGEVRSGFAPVAGASVYLFAAGEAGYGSASTLLNGSEGHAAVTNDDGSFAVTADRACPNPGSELYLVAEGGNAGAGVSPNLMLTASLGPCGGNEIRRDITINEVTTVAFAYALSGFVSDAAHVGTIGTNLVGLANAFASAYNLVNPESGTARAFTPAGNGVVPQAEINTIANVLNARASTGGTASDATACGRLSSQPRGASSTNTLQAALYFARHAENADPTGLASLFADSVESGPFTPVLEALPAGWSLALTFTGRDLANPRTISIDPAGNVWIANDAGVTEMNSAGAELPGSPFAAIPGNFISVDNRNQTAAAVDRSGNRWVLSGADNAVTEFIGSAGRETIAGAGGVSSASQDARP